MHDLALLLEQDARHEHLRAGQVGELVDVLAMLYEIIGPEPDWQQDAACRGQTSVMFPTRGEDPRPAKALCESCPVFNECATWAAENPSEFGIVAGTTARARRAARAA